MAGGLSVTRWASVRQLLHVRGREESGRLVVEGRRAVRTVLTSSITPEFILAGPESGRAMAELADLIESKRIQVYDLTARQTEDLAGTSHSQEVFAVLPWRPARGVPPVLPNLILHLSGIRNPVNMGALLRTAAAFGIAVTCSPDCVDVTHPVTVRGGAGSYFHLPLYVDVPLSELRLRTPHKIVYASASGGADLAHWVWPEHTVLVLGGEAEGATEPLDDAVAVHIPVQVESLNAAVAGGIMMWEAKRGVRQG
jgi:tRNA G18 (ribose-2'-O)-methylase SpoU